MKQYLSHDDADAFVDFEKKSKPDIGNRTVECPRCKGHGGWNLQINSYSLPQNMKDTAKNRHIYRHFRCSCGQCDGWGWVTEEDSKCLHEWGHHRVTAACEHEYTCMKCGKTNLVDSSG